MSKQRLWLLKCSHPDEMDNLLWRRDGRRLLGGCWRCRACERTRAQARRAMYGGSYWKYEHSDTRMFQRLWYPTLGAGAHRLGKTARGKAIRAWGEQRMRSVAMRYGLDPDACVGALRGKVNFADVILAADRVAAAQGG